MRNRSSISAHGSGGTVAIRGHVEGMCGSAFLEEIVCTGKHGVGIFEFIICDAPVPCLIPMIMIIALRRVACHVM